MADAKQVAADFAALSNVSVNTAAEIVAAETLEVQSDVKRRAARPRTAPSVAGLGPRIQTGDYNRSIGTHVERGGTEITGSVGTDKVQGYRLEKGFDAPGQRTLPHPHFGPAMDASEKRFPTRLIDAIGRLFR